MLYEVSHRTKYRYEDPVSQSNHLLHLSPRPMAWQTIHRHSVLIDPAPSNREELVDYFGNPATIITIENDHDEISFLATSTVEIDPRPNPDLASTPKWEDVALAAQNPVPNGEDVANLAQFACYSSHTTPTEKVCDYARASFTPGRPLLEAANDLSERIYNDFTYDGDATDVGTSIAALIEMKRGVCQDYAHFALACLRSHNLPARYISGYLLTHPPEGEPKLVGADASHAWFSVWVPGVGWIDFDPTNNVIPSGEHITVAYGCDFADVSPINGVVTGGGAHKVHVAVDVRRV